MVERHHPDDDAPGASLSEINHILNAKPGLLADAAEALPELGNRLSQHAREFQTDVLEHLDSPDPRQRAAAAETADRLAREVGDDIERLRMIDYSIGEALPGPDPVREAMAEFCRREEKPLRSLQSYAEQAAALLRSLNSGQ